MPPACIPAAGPGCGPTRCRRSSNAGSGCSPAARRPATARPARPAPAAEPCPFVYVYAPGNYIIEIASGAEVILDPGVQDFDLFCSPGEARTAVNEAVRIGVLPDGDWRIFRLDGTMEDLGQRQHNNQYMLNRMAQVVDWVTE